MSEQVKPPECEVDFAFDAIRVKYGGVIHLRLRRSALLGIQSWKRGQSNYFIEFTMVGGVITSEYDDAEKWKMILAKLDEIL